MKIKFSMHFQNQQSEIDFGQTNVDVNDSARSAFYQILKQRILNNERVRCLESFSV